VSLIIKPKSGPIALLSLLVSIPLSATPIYPDTEATTIESDSSPFERNPLVTIPLLEVSPVPTDKPTSLPDYSDPMDMGIDNWMSLFPGGVHFMDLLVIPKGANSTVAAEFELPPEALRGIDILDDLDSLYLSYDGRAFDDSILNLEAAEMTERRGLPVTTETAPVSLTDFGIIYTEQNRR
jgi:hypothetical protein